MNNENELIIKRRQSEYLTGILENLNNTRTKSLKFWEDDWILNLSYLL